jgi:hypothetical protein
VKNGLRIIGIEECEYIVTSTDFGPMLLRLLTGEQNPNLKLRCYNRRTSFVKFERTKYVTPTV